MDDDDRIKFICYTFGVLHGMHSDIPEGRCIQMVNAMLADGNQQLMTSEEEKYLERMEGLIFEFRMSGHYNRNTYRAVNKRGRQKEKERNKKYAH